MGKMSDDAQLELFSPERLAGYKDTREHEDNLFLISQIAHKIGILEIIVRNRIDVLLSAEEEDWIRNLPEKLLPRDLEKYAKDKIISKQTMGFWVKVAIYYKINDKTFDTEFLDSLDFKKYFPKNKNRFKNNKEFRRHQKAQAILELLRLIRNRAFHFENLYKFQENKYPRLNAVISDDKGNKIYIAVQPDKIKDFLNDLLASFQPDLIDYAENQGS